jgi:hypothetical protein
VIDTGAAGAAEVGVVLGVSVAVVVFVGVGVTLAAVVAEFDEHDATKSRATALATAPPADLRTDLIDAPCL